MPPHITDEELLAAADRDPEAFAAFYRRYAPVLLAWAARRTGDRERAADLVAETFAAALEGCHRFRPARGPAAAWLFGIARHKAARVAQRGSVEKNALRRLGVGRPPLGDEELERVLVTVSASPELARALEALPDEQRAAVRSRVVEELDYAEIAAATGSSEAVVRQRVSRGLASLRRRLSATSTTETDR